MIVKIEEREWEKFYKAESISLFIFLGFSVLMLKTSVFGRTLGIIEIDTHN